MLSARILELDQLDAECHRVIAEATEILRKNHEERKILHGKLLRIAPELEFDEKTRTVRWASKERKFGMKSFLFLKTLWDEKRHQAKTEKIERVVFGITGNAKQMFLPEKTLKQFLWRIRKELQEIEFPYKIVRSRSKKTHESQGFKLKCRRVYKRKRKNVDQQKKAIL